MFNNMKIGTRLVIMMALLLLFMIVIGVVGLYAASKANAGMKEMYQNSMIPAIRLNEISRKMLRNQIMIAKGINYPEHMNEYLKEIAENRAVINKKWDEYIKNADLSDGDKVLTGNFDAARARYVEDALKPAVAAMQANNVELIKQIQVQHIQPLFEPMNDALKH
ncbi:MAG: Tar ligand binding domain-containing protein [Nitrosomonadales bacterium]|nr:Tar ligand binding domain-containing protein [Nitrosomonadales bacterium]